MAGRTCKPDADFVRLWRTLMPGTPFPACGTAESGDAADPVTDQPQKISAGERNPSDDARRR